MYVCMYVCMYVRMYVCMHVCMYACMYACMHVCMYTCTVIYTYIVLRIRKPIGPIIRPAKNPFAAPSCKHLSIGGGWLVDRQLAEACTALWYIPRGIYLCDILYGIYSRLDRVYCILYTILHTVCYLTFTINILRAPCSIHHLFLVITATKTTTAHHCYYRLWARFPDFGARQRWS